MNKFLIYYKGYTLKDLQATSGDAFQTEASQWNSSRIITDRVVSSQCNDALLLGGFDVLSIDSTAKTDYFQRIYTSIPIHSTVIISFLASAISSWPYTSHVFTVELDSKTLNTFQLSECDFSATTCLISNVTSLITNTLDLTSVNIVGAMPHSGSSLTLKISTQNLIALGFNRINIMFSTVAFATLVGSPTTTSVSCATSSSSVLNNQCKCIKGQYPYSTILLPTVTLCGICNPVCASCFGISDTQCYECSPKFYFDGSKCTACDISCDSCYGAGSGSCSACAFGFTNTSGKCTLSILPKLFLFQSNDLADTVFDIDTASTYAASTKTDSIICLDFVLPDKSCQTSCDDPLIEEVIGPINFCKSPVAFFEFISWDQSCLASCNPPLVPRSFFGIPYCDQPCNLGEFWSIESNSCQRAVSLHGCLFFNLISKHAQDLAVKINTGQLKITHV